MKESFQKLAEFAKKGRNESPWFKTQNIDSFSPYLLEEAKEVISAVNSKDYTNFKEELGDIMWNVLILASMAEEEGHFTMKDILDTVYKKMNERRPYILEEKSVTREEEHFYWVEAKKKQKKNNF